MPKAEGVVTVPGNPVSVNHIYARGCRGVYLTGEAQAWKEAVAWCARRDWKRKPIAESVAATLEIYFGTKRTRDLDNTSKLVLDGLRGICYVDDVQVDELTIRRRFDKKRPRVVITVKEL